MACSVKWQDFGGDHFEGPILIQTKFKVWWEEILPCQFQMLDTHKISMSGEELLCEAFSIHIYQLPKFSFEWILWCWIRNDVKEKFYYTDYTERVSLQYGFWYDEKAEFYEPYHTCYTGSNKSLWCEASGACWGLTTGQRLCFTYHIYYRVSLQYGFSYD